MNEVGVELTAQELGVIAKILELPSAAGIENNPIDDLPEAARGPVTDAVIASLQAREIVIAGDGDDLDIADAVKLIMTVASMPSLIAVVSRQIDEVIETSFLSVSPELGVELAPIAHSVYRLTPFAAGDLLYRILRISDLHPVAVIEGAAPVDVSQEALDACAAHLVDGADEEALVALGGDPAAARIVVSALRTKRSSSQVTILHKPGDGQVEGGSLAWIDAGFGGVWTMEEQAEADQSTGIVRIENRDSRDLVVELFSYLPSAFAADGSPESAPE